MLTKRFVGQLTVRSRVLSQPRRLASGYRGIKSKRTFCTKPEGAGSKPTGGGPPPKQEGSRFGTYIILTAALAGAGYYFYDELQELLGMKKKKTEVPAVVSSETKPVQQKFEEKIEQVKSKAEEVKEEVKSKVEEVKEAVDENIVKPVKANLRQYRIDAANSSAKADWNSIRNEVVDLLESNPGHDDGSYGPIFVRLAWHSAGTFDKNTGKGGTEGAAMRFKHEGGWGANTGLDLARKVLEPIKKRHPEITYSDLWSFAGTVAIEEMGGPEMKWRPGRWDYDLDENILPDGLLPDADGRNFKEEPAKHVREIFHRMGFNDQETVALVGAHALGRCHTKNSGYDGPWTNAPTTFSNEFYRLLIEEVWTPRKWNGPLQFEDSSKKLMMTPADLSLAQDKGFRKYTEMYAKDEDKFFKDFAKAWMKLQENGVRKFHGWRRYYLFGPRE